MSGVINGVPFGQTPGRVFDVSGDVRTTITIPISTAASGDTTLVVAVTGKRIVVVDGAIVSAGAVNVKFESNTTDITGAMSLATGIPVPVGGFKTAASESLLINLSGAVQVSGWLEYYVAGV